MAPTMLPGSTPWRVADLDAEGFHRRAVFARGRRRAYRRRSRGGDRRGAACSSRSRVRSPPRASALASTAAASCPRSLGSARVARARASRTRGFPARGLMARSRDGMSQCRACSWRERLASGSPRPRRTAVGALRLLRQQERRRALQQRRQRRGDLDRGHVLLVLHLLEQRPKRLRLPRSRSASVMRSLNLSTRCSFTSATRRQRHGLDALSRHAFDDPQHVPLARRDEQNRLATAPRTARAADAVNVRLRVIRNVVVHDVRNALDVEPARRDVRRHDDVELAVLETRDRAFPLLLRNVAVQRGGAEAARFEPLRQIVRSRASCARKSASRRSAPPRACA